MTFSVNQPILFVITAIIIAYVLLQSVYFLMRAWRRARELGIAKDSLLRVVKSSIAFTIAPALAILIGLITLSKFLGLPLPWLRLSVLGALTYELPAAAAVANILGIGMDKPIDDASFYVSIAWVMTIGILSGIIIIALFQKRIQNGLLNLKKKSGKWNEYLMDALFIGMIAAFLGMIFGKITAGLAGWIPLFVMLFSAALMIVQGLIIKKYQTKWLENYALPFSMIGAMLFAVVITGAIG